MGIHSNSPTLSYVTLKGVIITYKEKIYNIENFQTNLQFVYWDLDLPHRLNASNIAFDESSTKFMIGMNKSGDYSEVNLSDLNVSYDGNSYEATRTRIEGLYEKTDEHTEQFISVEQNINGIKQTVGKWEEGNGTISEKISKIDQRADGIDLSVDNINKTYKYDELRNNVNKTLIDLNSALGLFYSNSLDYFKDDSITQEEKQEIQVQYALVNDKRDKLFTYVTEVITRLTENKETEKVTRINNAKEDLNISLNNLQTNMNNVISDNVITPSDRTLIINSFSTCNLKVNFLKSVIDSAIVLGLGGSISESLAQINMKSNEINLNVQETDKNAKAQIKILSNEISSKVSEGELSSIIQQSSNDIKIGFNGITDNVVINENGLTVNKGSIACQSITTPTGTDPIITLFGQCSLDATLNSETGGFGQYMRMKWDNANYLAIGQGNAIFYQKFGTITNNVALKIDMTNNKTTRLSGEFGEMLLADHGLYYPHNIYANGTQVSVNGHSHRASDIEFSRTDSAYFGNVSTGSSSTSYCYMGGYFETSGDVKGRSFIADSGQVFGSNSFTTSTSSDYIENDLDKLNKIEVYEIPNIVTTNASISALDNEIDTRLCVNLNQDTPQEIINKDDDGKKGIDIYSMGCLNTKSIQQLINEFSKMQNRINELELIIKDRKE